jgi:hypothetical protein
LKKINSFLHLQSKEKKLSRRYNNTRGQKHQQDKQQVDSKGSHNPIVVFDIASREPLLGDVLDIGEWRLMTLGGFLRTP